MVGNAGNATANPIPSRIARYNLHTGQTFMNNSYRYMLIILLTPIYFILAAWVSALPHEYAHSVTAWMLGFKQHPFGIQYGHLTWQNILFFA